jgi:DEAD/DEAH box helicase domain-containing protein
VHSPKCGSGNRPIDKSAAIFILKQLKQQAKSPSTVTVQSDAYMPLAIPPEAGPAKSPHFAVFDLETQRSAAEVGGWHRAHLMKVSCAVLYDSREDRFIEFMEDQIGQLIDRLQSFDLIVGFNINRFDYRVLKGYSEFDFLQLKNLDILETVEKYLGFRLSLAHLASATLGESKSADGLQALRWWQQGRLREIVAYCRQDVKITRDLYCFGRDHRHLLFRDKSNRTARIPVNW